MQPTRKIVIFEKNEMVVLSCNTVDSYNLRYSREEGTFFPKSGGKRRERERLPVTENIGTQSK